MAYLLTNALADLISTLGQSDTFPATGGTTATIINSKIGERARQPKESYAIDYYAFVLVDAGGASAAPEGQFRRISAYDSGTYTFTVDTVYTAAVAAGDRIMIASSIFPVFELMNLINVTMRRLTIVLPDITLTTVDGKQVYTLPVTAKRDRPRKVEIQTIAGDNDSYVERSDYEITYAAPGSTGLLRFRDGISGGMTVRMQVDNSHSPLIAATDAVSETIPPERMQAECLVTALEWYNNRTGGSDTYWTNRENMARDELMAVRRTSKISKPSKSPQLFVAPI